MKCIKLILVVYLIEGGLFLVANELASQIIRSNIKHSSQLLKKCISDSYQKLTGCQETLTHYCWRSNFYLLSFCYDVLTKILLTV